MLACGFFAVGLYGGFVQAGVGFLLAGVVALLSGPTLWYEGWQLPTILNLFILVMVLNLLVECLDPVRARWSRPDLMRVGLGLALGLAYITAWLHRAGMSVPVALLFLAFVLLHALSGTWAGINSSP